MPQRCPGRAVSILVGAGLALATGAGWPRLVRAQSSPPPRPTVDTVPQPPTPPVPGGEPVRPRFAIKAEKGFIDDAFALAPDASVLAVLLTDAASFARIDLVDLATGKPRRTVEIGDPHRLFERIVVAEDGEGLVLVSRDAGSGRRSAQFFDRAGKAAGILGPVDEIGVHGQGDERVLVTLTRQDGRAGESFKVGRHRIAGLGRVGTPRQFVINKSGDLRQPPLKLAAWQRGFAELVGLRPGYYDKQRDVRLPDRGAIVDTRTGQVTWEAEVGDVVAWAAATQLRAKLPGRSLFALFSPDTSVFDLVDYQGRRSPIALPVPLRYYDPSTLQEQEDYQGSLLVSLATDPLHPEALTRRRKDPSFLDLYWLRPATVRPAGPTGRTPLEVTVERLLRAPMDERPATWAVSGQHAAVLRKHKNFSRGGNLLEVYPLARTAPY